MIEFEIGTKLTPTGDLAENLKGIGAWSEGDVFEYIECTIGPFGPINHKLKNSKGIGVFTRNEISQFIEYKPEPVAEPVKLSDDIKKVHYNDEKKAVAVILKSGHKGIAKCHHTDPYTREDGYKVAYAKAKISEQQELLDLYTKKDKSKDYRLVFTKKAYILLEGVEKYQNNKGWVDKCNGREPDEKMRIDQFSVAEEWCEKEFEIPKKKRLFFSKEKCMKRRYDDITEESIEWMDYCDGKEVDKDMFIGIYDIHKDWCIEK